MSTDPIVEQVRAVRKEIEQQYPDAESFYRHLREHQEAYRQQLVRRGRKRVVVNRESLTRDEDISQ